MTDHLYRQYEYTTTGAVRGDCGHGHRTLETAERCLSRDRAGCARQGGYSDRRIVLTEPGGPLQVVIRGVVRDAHEIDDWEDAAVEAAAAEDAAVHGQLQADLSDMEDIG